MSRMERAWTFLILGTRRPVGVSMATPMLWLDRITRAGLVGLVVVSTLAFRRGKEFRERETALMMKGR